MATPLANIPLSLSETLDVDSSKQLASPLTAPLAPALQLEGTVHIEAPGEPSGKQLSQPNNVKGKGKVTQGEQVLSA
jgi:hypothetical protein